jgi:hypothetical protein
VFHAFLNSSLRFTVVPPFPPTKRCHAGQEGSPVCSQIWERNFEESRSIAMKTTMNQSKNFKKSLNDEQQRDDSDNNSIGSIDTLESSSKVQPQPLWPWRKYLPERYLPQPSSGACEEHESEQCEFCGPPPPTNAAYLKQYNVHLPSLLE